MKKLRNLKKWVTLFNEIKSKIEELEIYMEFAKNGESNPDEIIIAYNNILELLENLEFKNMLSDEGDNLSAVVQITAGAGGTESCDWAEMLMRMYIMWAEKKGFKIRELNNQAGDVAGLKTVTLELEKQIFLALAIIPMLKKRRRIIFSKF